MAYLKMYRNKLRHNYKILNKLLNKHEIDWGVTTKLLCGNKKFLNEVLDLKPKQVCDSRVSNLKAIKKINPNIETMYIKPVPRRSIPSVVRFADISLNTEHETIKLLAKEARKQKKVHKIIIMVEMGDLREGVLGKDLVGFYSKIFKLKGIEVVGIGTNLNCFHGVMPSHDKLIQLALYKQILELRFQRSLKLLSGGSTVALPLIYRKQLPKAINHFRIGEALFFGADLFTKKTLKGMFANVFELFAEIIEISEKPMVPIGELDTNPSGEKFEIKEEDYGKESYRALVDIGILDVNHRFLDPTDPDIKIISSSSDMMSVEMTKGKKNYKPGSLISFNLNYMGVLGIMNSNYIDKVVI